jgi:hypothetical protein
MPHHLGGAQKPDRSRHLSLKRLGYSNAQEAVDFEEGDSYRHTDVSPPALVIAGLLCTCRVVLNPVKRRRVCPADRIHPLFVRRVRRGRRAWRTHPHSDGERQPCKPVERTPAPSHLANDKASQRGSTPPPSRASR